MNYNEIDCVNNMKNTICEVCDFISMYTGIDIANKLEDELVEKFIEVEEYIKKINVTE